MKLPRVRRYCDVTAGEEGVSWHPRSTLINLSVSLLTFDVQDLVLGHLDEVSNVVEVVAVEVVVALHLLLPLAEVLAEDSDGVSRLATLVVPPHRALYAIELHRPDRPLARRLVRLFRLCGGSLRLRAGSVQTLLRHDD